jgi:beta-glucanase (GH16 family)
MIFDVGRRVGALAVVVLAIGPLSPASAAATVGGNPTGATTQWTLSWADDFDGTAGSAPDSTRWSYDTGGQGWSQYEQQDYTTSTRNSRIDGTGHHLLIDAHTGDVPQGATCGTPSSSFPCGYTSARLVSRGKFQQQYGRFEIRAKMPSQSAFWPAFWALGTSVNCWPEQGEIDFAEIFDDESGHNTVHGGVHGPRTATTACANTPDQPAGGHLNLTDSGYDPLSAGYHVYSGDWFPDHVSMAVDGHTYATVYKSDHASWPFDQPFSLLLNMAVGVPGRLATPAADQAVLAVDYVHVFTPANPSATITDRVFGLGAADAHCIAAKTTPADGVPVIPAACGTSSLQQVTAAPDSLRISGKCLAAVASAVQLRTCDGTAAQQWRLESNQTLLNPGPGGASRPRTGRN